MRSRSISAPCLGLALLVCGCTVSPAPRPVEVIRQNPAPAKVERLEITVAQGVIRRGEAGDGVAAIPLPHEAVRLNLFTDATPLEQRKVVVFRTEGTPLTRPWSLTTAGEPTRLWTRRTTLQPIPGAKLRLRVEISADGVIRLRPVDEAGAPLGEGFSLEHGGFVWVGSLDWNHGVSGTLISIQPARPRG